MLVLERELNRDAGGGGAGTDIIRRKQCQEKRKEGRIIDG